MHKAAAAFRSTISPRIAPASDWAKRPPPARPVPANLQGAAAGRLGAAAILPDVKDLPEFMQEAELKRRYGGIGGAEYRKMMAEIERRVAALAVFR